MPRTTLSAAVALAASLGLAGCDGRPAATPPVEPARAPVPPPPAAPGASESPAPRDGVPVFEERGLAAGIHFRMDYIPSEQGQPFKVNLYDHGTGVAVGDYDGDGRDDVYLLNQMGPNALYRNDGGGLFTEMTWSCGADVALADRMCVAAVFGDYDGDGRQDLFVTTVRAGNALFHNEGDGRFTDVTKAAGVALVAHSAGATFLDADEDGDLDLFVTCTAKWTSSEFNSGGHFFVGPDSIADFMRSPPEDNVFYRNDGDGTFSEATKESGLAARGWCDDAAVFDFDGDGHLDVFLSSMFGGSGLYRNDGRGHFTEVTKTVLGRVPFGALGARAFDFDLDGRLDLFVADMHSDMWATPDTEVKTVQPQKKYAALLGPLLLSMKQTPQQERELAERVHLDYQAVFFGNGLYRNLSGGKFEEVSDRAGAETFQPWGVVPGDYRNAGLEDVFMPAGMGYPFEFWPNEYLLNKGDGTFAPAARAAGLETPPGGPFLDRTIGGSKATRGSRSAATADFDGDGRIDLVVNNFRERAYLYMNRSPERPWIEFRLVGTTSNRDAIGALVTIRTGGRTMIRQVQAAGGYLSQSTKTLHFGLGDATSVESCDIVWPSGTRQHLEKPAALRRHEIREPPK